MTEHVSFTHLVLIGALVDAAVGGAVLLGLPLLRRRRVGLIDVLLAGALAGFGAFVQLVMADDGFGRLHVAYLYLFVTLPLLGVVLAASATVPRLRPRGPVLAIAGVLLLLAAVGFYGTHVEPYRLRTERVAIDVPAVDGEPIRIGVLSDLQTDGIGGYEQDAISRMLAEEPDLILLAGDYFQSDGHDFEAALPEIRSLMRRLEAPYGVYLVEGDVDSPWRMSEITRGSDLRWLDGEVATVEVRGVTVHIGGIPLQYWTDRAQQTMDELAGMDDGGVRILLAHRPDAAFHLADDGADLVVAGHTHGGQVQLPWIGPPITMSNVPRDVAAGGLHTLDGHRIYLSTGVGLQRSTAPQVRLNARPSIGIVTLR
jgi:uncharacterized protein